MPSAEWKDRAVSVIKSYDERMPFVLNAALAFNLLYAVFKLTAGVWYHSFWMMGLGAYYGLLAGIRFLLLRCLKQEDLDTDLKAYRYTALLLLSLTIVMAGIVVQTVVNRGAYDYPGLLIYVFAAFAFGKITAAVMALIRRRNDENRVLAAARCVSFAQALMSVLALQVALINRFGGENPVFAQTMNAVAGGGVCLLVILMSVRMLVKASETVSKAG